MRILLLFLIILVSCKADTPPPVVELTAPIELSDQDLVNQLYTYYYNNAQTQDQREQNAIIDYAVEKNIGFVRSPTGLYYHIASVGTGPFLQRKDQIEVEYSGFFLNGKLFDSSHRRGKPLVFKIGSMIAGWNEVLTYGKIGSRIQVCIPSRLAYGEEGLSSIIPANTPLYFEIDILKKVD